MSTTLSKETRIAINELLNANRPTDEYFEQMLGENLRFYYKNTKVSSLPVAVLYRIIIIHLKSNSVNQSFTDFLFDQLELKGRDAAPLFTVIDVTSFEDEFLNKICSKYDYVIPFLKTSHMFYLMDEKKRI